MNIAAKIITDAINGNDFKTVLVNGKAYTIYPPAVYKMSGAIGYLSGIDLKNGATMKEVLLSLGEYPSECSHALSWFINGDDSLFEELAKGTFEENVEALSEAVSLVSTDVFTRLLVLARNVAKLAAVTRM